MRVAKAAVTTATVLGLAIPVHAKGAEPMRLIASTKWRMEYAEDSCELLREYGTGNDKVLMAMQQFGPGEYFQLTLVGKPVRTNDETRDIRIRFGPEEWQTVSHARGRTQDKLPITFVSPKVRFAATKRPESPNDLQSWLALASLSPEREDKVTEFQFDAGRGVKNVVVLELGPMGAPMAALRKCTDDLLTTWGLNPEKQKALIKPATPKSNPWDWMKSLDYPRVPLWSGERAIINFRLTVDMGGQPTGCHIQAAVGGPEFGKAVCSKIMQRASFEPAVNAAGQPVASYFVYTVRFDVPDWVKKQR